MQDGRKVNVLLVDDQPSNLLTLEALLGGADLNLVRAQSGEQALLRVLDDDYAAILMDVQMPGLGGFETAELIRERDRSRHTPILFLTAFQSDEAQVARGYALGAVDFLSKPIVPAVLRAKVAVFVELYLKTEQIREQAERLVDTQRQAHERALADERRRWEVDRLREEAAREKRTAEALAQKARELEQSIAERLIAEEQLWQRTTQQEIVVELGQLALDGPNLDVLLSEAVAGLARGLGTDFARVMELDAASERLTLRAGHGCWPEGAEWSEEAEGSASLAGITLSAGEPVIIDDLGTDARFAIPGRLLELGIVSGLSVVLPGRDRPFGTLGAFSTRTRTFSRDDVHFHQAVANVVAAAIQRRRDEADLAAVRDELEIQLADMTRLHTLNEQLSGSLELPEVLERVLEAVTGLQGADRGVVTLYDPDRRTMPTAASIGFEPDQLADGGNGTGPLAFEGTPDAFSGGTLVADVESIVAVPVVATHVRVARRVGCRTVCITPLLIHGGDFVGTIATYFPRVYRPSDRETGLVELYARQAAASIENARLYRELREADRRKGEFLAMLGHELRNPLSPILNAVHLFGLPGTTTKDLEYAMPVVERQVRHLARLVDDLLDVSRINTGKVELRPSRFDLREATARALETSRPILEEKNHTLTLEMLEEPLPLLADATRLEQVLGNLLNNAAKYTEPGGRIELEVRREGDEGVVRVRDNGIGMDPEVLARIFDLFAQADRSLDRSQGGLGIGLTLARRLVEMHGGSLQAKSEGLGLGSEFSVRLPLAKAPSGLSKPSASEPRPAFVERPRRVLIVDDNIDGARLLARILDAGGHLTTLAHDGVQALAIARGAQPDAILLDIGLPGMDGYEVARRLRQTEGLQRVLLIAVTGYGQDRDRARSIDAGFDYHLVKPVDVSSIRELIALHAGPSVEESPVIS